MDCTIQKLPGHQYSQHLRIFGGRLFKAPHIQTQCRLIDEVPSCQSEGGTSMQRERFSVRFKVRQSATHFSSVPPGRLGVNQLRRIGQLGCTQAPKWGKARRPSGGGSSKQDRAPLTSTARQPGDGRSSKVADEQRESPTERSQTLGV